MKKTISLALSIMMLFSAFSGIQAFAASDKYYDVDISIEQNYDYANEVLDIVNNERNDKGLSSLEMDEELATVAMRRAAELVVYFSHTRPDGSDCFTASSKMSGENISAGYSTPKYVMQGWMESPGHKSNILNSRWNSIGVGCVKYGNTYYWVQCFSSSSAVASNKEGKENNTYKISVSEKNFELHYNSTTSFHSYYIDNAYYITMVSLNKGWDGRCYTIDNSKFDLNSSDESVFKINTEGRVYPIHEGSAKLTAVFKQDTSKVIETQINISNVHDYSILKEDVAPTCKEDGKKVYECSVCKKEKTQVIDSTNEHDYELIETTNGNCVTYSKKKYRCKECGQEKTVYDDSCYTGSHNYKNEYVSPTCTESGYYKSYCTVCGYETYKEYQAQGHYFGEENESEYCYYCGVKNPDYKSYLAFDNDNYEDYISAPETYEVNPIMQTKTVIKVKPTSIKKLSKGKRSFIIKWKKVSNITGYQIQYSTNKKFTKNSKTLTVKGAAVNSKTIKKLKKNKKYYVRVRTYKKIGNKTLVSEWSSAKSVTTKK